MSLDATRWAWQQSDIRPADKFVLLSIADRADEHHWAFPSIERLANDTRLNRKTVMECIKRLEQAGLLKSVRVQGKSNIYQLVGVCDRHSTSPKNGTCAENGTSPKNGTPPVPKTGPDQSQKRDTNLPRTYQEPTKSMSGKPDAAQKTRKRRETAKAILAFLNDKAKKNFRPVPANLETIEARLKEGATEQELRQVVARKARDWLTDETMSQYLRPATLFNRTKFAQYQGELVTLEDDNGE